MKRTLAVFLAFSILVLNGLAQSNRTPATEKPPATKPGTAAQSLPSEATVNAFFHRMFGWNENLVFKVAAIRASPIRGLAEVDAIVSTPNGQQKTSLLISSDQDYAVVGNVLQFPDPFAKDRAILNKDAFGPVRGSATPAITLVEFSDLECPACKAAQPVFDRLMNDETNTRLIFQNFPLDKLHPWAEKAADYMDCIARDNNDAAWKFIANVYAQQDVLNQQNQAGAAALTAKLNEIAGAAGVDADKVATCSSSPETKARIEKSRKLGEEVGVAQTPTLFVNGRRIEDATSVPYEVLKSVVDFEISQGGK